MSKSSNRGFGKFKVNVLHTMDLHTSKGEFKGWSVLRKQAFVARICQVMSRHVMMGVSVSALKKTYRSHKAKRTLSGRQTTSPYAWCLNWIVDNTLRSTVVGKEANTDGLALILECGNEHNTEAEKSFYEIRDQHRLKGVLRSISFVPKQECRAIQVADLLAFYSRRHGVAMEGAPTSERSRLEPSLMMKLSAGSVPHRAFVATNFGDKEDDLGSRFFGGPLEGE